MICGSSHHYENTISRISELNQDLYLWVIQTIWDEEFNCTTEFVVNGQELKIPNYSKKIDFWMSSTVQVSINLHHPMFTGNRKFDIKIGKIEDTTILDGIKEENSYNYNRLLKYSKENSSIFSDNLQTGNVACSYYNEQEVLFDGATLLEDGEYYYIYILLDDENGKYYPFEAAVPAKATVWEDGWYLKTVDSIIDNNEVTDEKWYVETEVDSLEWTEEDINKILADIEETRNNTTDKQLYVHVPSGSKVPAKIFEASKGIDITIISEDGIWAYFTGGSYKAIDYVAGGKISNKAIDGMVNVGENTIVYFSLNHEGQLPSSCVISYYNGLTKIGLGVGVDDTFVDTKLYYFNKDVQKYELCGSGHMSLPYDIYDFKIDHCSSYVMSEETLPDEFIIKTTTEEETKKEEPKKEEPKPEDKTKAPGSLPYTGGTFIIIVSVLAIIALGIYAYRRNNDLKGI